MSSPLSMLKKTRRTPLQVPADEHRASPKVPFRRNLLREIQVAYADDHESSDPNPPDMTLPTPANNASSSKTKAPLKKGAPPSDLELMSSMMKRVTLLEKTVQSQAQEIEHKDKRISVLEKRMSLLKDPGSSRDLRGRERDLEIKCEQLQNQVCEMESFLNDYGLIWVGNESEEQPQKLEKADTAVESHFRMNFDLVLERIRELNILSGDGECFVKSTATGAQLAKKDPIQLSLYSNGIVMFDGPFRSYQENNTQQCMQDLMDGYFPSELQERFPDGVPFQVCDRREEELISRQLWGRFPGEGKAVHGLKDESLNTNNSSSTDKTLSTDQFLNRLPKMVVKAGRVIEIRESVKATLQGSSGAPSSNSLVLVETPELQAMRERLKTSSTGRPSTAHDIITLKVKSEDGNHTYILKMCLSETIGNLRKYLDHHRGRRGLPGYDIISVYPQCCYDDNGQTLQACGLTTNANLLLRKQLPHALTEVNKIHS